MAVEDCGMGESAELRRRKKRGIQRDILQGKQM